MTGGVLPGRLNFFYRWQFGRCYRCGGTMRLAWSNSATTATEDHIVPRKRGGKRPFNVLFAHARCNHERGSHTKPTACELMLAREAWWAWIIHFEGIEAFPRLRCPTRLATLEEIEFQEHQRESHNFCRKHIDLKKLAQQLDDEFAEPTQMEIALRAAKQRHRQVKIDVVMDVPFEPERWK